MTHGRILMMTRRQEALRRRPLSLSFSLLTRWGPATAACPRHPRHDSEDARRAARARRQAPRKQGREERGDSPAGGEKTNAAARRTRACLRTCVPACVRAHARARARVFAQRIYAGKWHRRPRERCGSPTGSTSRERTCDCTRPHARNVLGRFGLFTTALYLFPWSAILLLFVPREPRTRTAVARLRRTRPHRARHRPS